MMKKIILVIAFFVVIINFSTAQDTSNVKSYKKGHVFDLAISTNGKEYMGALEWNHLHGLGKKKQRFKVGYGIRYTGYYSENQFYTTAPSKFTSTVQGPTTLFSETIETNIDTVALPETQVNSINIAIHLEYAITPKLDVGFSIDAVGLSFGSEKQASVISNVYDPGQPPVAMAKPTTLNALLTSDNDIGSLNSEFYVGYWLSPKVRIRAGYTFYFSEYTTDNELSFDGGRIKNDRYRLKSGLGMIAISWKPFNN